MRGKPSVEVKLGIVQTSVALRIKPGHGEPSALLVRDERLEFLVVHIVERLPVARYRPARTVRSASKRSRKPARSEASSLQRPVARHVVLDLSDLADDRLALLDARLDERGALRVSATGAELVVAAVDVVDDSREDDRPSLQDRLIAVGGACAVSMEPDANESVRSVRGTGTYAKLGRSDEIVRER